MKYFKLFLLSASIIITQQSFSQIGYQVSLLNSATGEPRKAETVNVTVSLTNNEGEVIHTETQSATTNDFGVLALTIGNKNTFTNVDWLKLPFYIAVSANSKLIGKCQILSVPIAEYAKTSGVLTREILCSKTWIYNKRNDEGIYSLSYSFGINGTGTFMGNYEYEDAETGSFTYEIEGNNVAIIPTSADLGSDILFYFPKINALLNNEGMKFE